MLETFLVLWGLAATASFFAQLRIQRYATAKWIKASKDLVDERSESARLRNESMAKAAECVELKRQLERLLVDNATNSQAFELLSKKYEDEITKRYKLHNEHEAIKLELQKLCGMKEQA